MEGGAADARVPSSGGLTQKYAGHKERPFVIRFGSLAKGMDPSGVRIDQVLALNTIKEACRKYFLEE